MFQLMFRVIWRGTLEGETFASTKKVWFFFAARTFAARSPPPVARSTPHGGYVMPQPNASDPLKSLAVEGLRALKLFSTQHQDF